MFIKAIKKVVILVHSYILHKKRVIFSFLIMFSVSLRTNGSLNAEADIKNSPLFSNKYIWISVLALEGILQQIIALTPIC